MLIKKKPIQSHKKYPKIIINHYHENKLHRIIEP